MHRAIAIAIACLLLSPASGLAQAPAEKAPFFPDLGRFHRPRIRALPLAEAARGHIELENPRNYGKLILVTPWGETLLEAAPDSDNPIESA